MKKLTLSIIGFIAGISISLNAIGQAYNITDMDEFILEQMEIFHVPGLSAVIVKGDSVVWNSNFGYMILEDSIPVNDSSLFAVYSIGKSVTSACVMQLWDEGLLGLDQSINDFLPFEFDNPLQPSDSISARMLMSHTASIRDGNIYTYVTIGDPTITLHYFMENYFGAGGEFYGTGNFYNLTPGTQFHYSNYGIALNGFLVEALTGVSFKDYIRNSLLTPLHMDASAWFLSELNMNNLSTGYSYSGGSFLPKPHYGHPAYPGLSLRSTALELANYVIMLLNHGEFEGVNILSAAAVDSMSTVQNPNWTFSYGVAGLGLFKREGYGNRVVWGHNGGSSGGFANHFYFCPEENSGIVITTNSEQYVDPIVEYLFDYAETIITKVPSKTHMEELQLSFYPNPACEYAYLRINNSYSKKIEITLFTTDGILVKSWKHNLNQSGEKEFRLDMHNLPAGIYFCRVQIGNEMVTKKIIKL